MVKKYKRMTRPAEASPSITDGGQFQLCCRLQACAQRITARAVSSVDPLRKRARAVVLDLAHVAWGASMWPSEQPA
jgi:hypothetical protein